MQNILIKHYNRLKHKMNIIMYYVLCIMYYVLCIMLK